MKTKIFTTIISVLMIIALIRAININDPEERKISTREIMIALQSYDITFDDFKNATTKVKQNFEKIGEIAKAPEEGEDILETLERWLNTIGQTFTAIGTIFIVIWELIKIPIKIVIETVNIIIIILGF